MKIAFLGYGEAARAFRKSLAAEHDHLAFAAYDVLQDEPDRAAEMRGAMERDAVECVDAPADLCCADWIFSAVTADQSLEAVKSVSGHLTADQVLVDINSVSPERKRESAAIVEASGAQYLDMAVMAPVHPRGHRTPVLVAGPAAEQLATLLSQLGFDHGHAGPEAGAATAIKMVRSLFVKGLEAITVETLLAAETSGCFETILASLSGSFPGLGWPEFPAYQFQRTLQHGARRAAEMRESAATLRALGLHSPLAEAIADVQAKMGAAGVESGGDLAETVKRAGEARAGRGDD